MAGYKHVLLATDLGADAADVGRRAVELTSLFQARLSIIHIVEVLSLDVSNDLILPQIDAIAAELQAQAQERLASLADQLGKPAAHLEVQVGPTKPMIIDFARDRDVDLIVIGKRSRHGLGRLLGSTANAVLSHAPCDVLAVVVGETE